MQFQQRAGTTTTDRQCNAVSQCLSSEFAVIEATATSDRRCQLCGVCPGGHIKVSGQQMVALGLGQLLHSFPPFLSKLFFHISFLFLSLLSLRGWMV